jgi:zinc/manganese transport system substrate-binding protein
MVSVKRGMGGILFALFCLLLSACGGPAGGGGSTTTAGIINVVAAENFYGDIVQQLGGKHVAVTSVLSDPNVDPHEYESNVQNGIAVSKAQLVIANGGGYDGWMDKLLSAAPSSNRIVLKGFDIAPHKLADNEHVWYGIDNVQAVAQSVTASLTKLDAADGKAFASNLQTFTRSLGQITKKIGDLKAKYAGIPVGLTETIFLYQSQPMGLNILTPFDFQKAVAESNDPPATTVVTVNTQISQRRIKVLIYNEQTITPLTTRLQDAARTQGIPIVPVTETMPTGRNYQQWMLDQLAVLEQALQSGK